MSKLLTTITLLCFSVAANAATPPDLVCTSEKSISISNLNLISSDISASNSLYRFSHGSLYLSFESREEYLYGEVEEVEYLRYVTGNKTIIFKDSSFLRAVSSHFDKSETTVMNLRCVKT